MYAIYHADPCKEGADEYLKKSFEKIVDQVERAERSLFKIKREILNQLLPGVKEKANVAGPVRPAQPDEVKIGIPNDAPNVYYIDREFLRSTQFDTSNTDDQLKSLKNLSLS